MIGLEMIMSILIMRCSLYKYKSKYGYDYFTFYMMKVFYLSYDQNGYIEYFYD